MSDISIPGVKSKYDTQKLIEDLMKVERVPKVRAGTDLKKLETSKSVWQDLGVRMSKVRDSARTMFSFKNPFSERVTKSSDDAVLTGTATREALIETRSILVKQIAESDRFLSKNLPKDFKVPSGLYAFAIGEKSVQIQYSGGTLKDFAEAVSRKGKDSIKVSVIQVTADTQSLAVESLVTGKQNRLSFDKAALDLALDTALVERASSSTRKFDIAESGLRQFVQPLDTKTTSILDGTLKLRTGAEVLIPAEPPVTMKNGMLVEFEIRVSKLPETEALPESEPKGPVLPDPGSMTYEGITIKNAGSETVLPQYVPPPKPEKISDLQIVHVKTGGKFIPLALSEESGEFVKIQVPVSPSITNFEGLGLRNRNTFREVEIRNIRVFDPDENAGLKPVRPISTARDAIVSMDGIEVTRDKNDISNLIPGVTITVHETAEKPVKLKIEPDRESAKNAIIAFVGEYNKLSAKLNILSRADDKIISELDYFTEEEKKTAREQLGLFQGDFTINQIKTQTLRIVSAPYPTSIGQGLALLAQIGVSTDARTLGSGYDSTKLRGYLEIDEAALDKALTGDMNAIRQLFGNDTDGDLIMDSGVAYSMDALLKPYVETGGILGNKTQTLDGQISSQKLRIESLDKQLAKKEDDLKRKYGMMEGALNSMERTSGSIDNFSKNSNQ